MLASALFHKAFAVGPPRMVLLAIEWLLWSPCWVNVLKLKHVSMVGIRITSCCPFVSRGDKNNATAKDEQTQWAFGRLEAESPATNSMFLSGWSRIYVCLLVFVFSSNVRFCATRNRWKQTANDEKRVLIVQHDRERGSVVLDVPVLVAGFMATENTTGTSS